MEDKTLNERINRLIYTQEGVSNKATNEIEKLILSEIEKAFDAGKEFAYWDVMGRHL